MQGSRGIHTPRGGQRRAGHRVWGRDVRMGDLDDLPTRLEEIRIGEAGPSPPIRPWQVE